MWLGKWFYLTNSKYKQHYTVQQNMLMTQQSQRPWGHTTVVAEAGPSSRTYVHQHQSFTLEEVAASSDGHPLNSSHPCSHLLQTAVPSTGWGVEHGEGGLEYGFILSVGYMCFWPTRAASTAADAHAPAPLPASSLRIASRRPPPRPSPAFTRRCWSWTSWIAWSCWGGTRCGGGRALSGGRSAWTASRRGGSGTVSHRCGFGSAGWARRSGRTF